MGVKIAIFAAIAIAVCASGAVALFTWWRDAEREVDEKAAQVEAYRAADVAGRDAVHGFFEIEKGALDERGKKERDLRGLDGADDGDFWRGIERLLDDDEDADARRSSAGIADDALRGGGD